MSHMQMDQENIEQDLQENRKDRGKEDQKEKKTIESEDFKVFFLIFSEMKDPEEKIRKAIEFMRSRLSLSASPGFRDFWEVRKVCLPLFKENIFPRSRAELWQQYIDLSEEARRLKEILDEQSAFAYEQIDLAVQALVQDLSSYQAIIDQMPEISLLFQVQLLEDKKDRYNFVQKELHFLNSLAAKVNALRKEVIKTDMRIRSKNKLFEKLSECGDRIFPRRKELIKEISEEFVKDVEEIFGKHFQEGKESLIPLHILREEIKALQAIAKILTLNTHAFTETRVKLSACWDLLKEWDKEKKKEFSEKRAQMQQEIDALSKKVQEFETLCQESQEFSLLEKAYLELALEIKEGTLGRFEVKGLKDRMDVAKKPHEEARAQVAREAQEKDKRQEEERIAKVQGFKAMVESVLEEADTLSAEVLLEKKQYLEECYKNLSIMKTEKALLDRSLKQIKDRVLEAKGRRLLSLSDDEQEQYEGLKAVLQEKRERRQEMKAQMEVYRKALGGSSFDFEKAMACQELLEMEKQSLQKNERDIEEIEEKIADLEG